ncbi:MAG: hypothetical protein ACJ74F_26065 [Mycobacterium sp.]|jgi:hypothetical protein|uniref:hypothetical protein n=1 Tax=Mycobacterium sp. TaxID=1785 RepID=UPI003200FCFB
MKRFTLGLASASAFAALAIGLASPAMAAPRDITPNYDAVYVTDGHTASYQPVDCSVHVNSGGTDVNVNWC